MGYQPSLADLVEQIKHASENIADGDARTNKRFAGIEKSINELYLKQNRPGGWATSDNATFERKSAIELCQNRRSLAVPKIDVGIKDDYQSSPQEIDDALMHRKAIKALLRHGDADVSEVA